MWVGKLKLKFDTTQSKALLTNVLPRENASQHIFVIIKMNVTTAEKWSGSFCTTMLLSDAPTTVALKLSRV